MNVEWGGAVNKISAADLLYSVEHLGRFGRLRRDHDGPCSETVISEIKESCEMVSKFIEGLRVPATESSIYQLIDICNGDEPKDKDVARHAYQVFERLNLEIGDQWLVILNHNASDYLNDDLKPFGDAVYDAFPNMVYDIDEAAKSLGLGRSTASVFHLMRVMEMSVHALAQNMRVNIDLREARWHDITTSMGSALNKMPNKPSVMHKKKIQYGEVVAHLSAVRIAWRNEVMHPKRSYSHEEAQNIFNHVKDFIKSIVPLFTKRKSRKKVIDKELLSAIKID